jgi:hypothetical protein
MLKKIDTGELPLSAMGEVVKRIRDMYDVISKESDFKEQTQDINPETLKGYQRALNAYLKYLIEVTDSFTSELAKEINPSIKLEDISNDEAHRKTLDFFKYGLLDALFKKYRLPDLTEQALDVLEAAIKRFKEADIQPNISTQFIVTSNVNTASLPKFSWRQELIEGINYDPESHDALLFDSELFVAESHNSELNDYTECDSKSSKKRYKLVCDRPMARTVMVDIFRECLFSEGLIKQFATLCKRYKRENEEVMAICKDNDDIEKICALLNMRHPIKRITTAESIDVMLNAGLYDYICKMKELIRSYSHCFSIEPDSKC